MGGYSWQERCRIIKGFGLEWTLESHLVCIYPTKTVSVRGPRAKLEILSFTRIHHVPKAPDGLANCLQNSTHWRVCVVSCVCVCVLTPLCVPQLSPQQCPRWLGVKGTTLWRAPPRGRRCQSPSPLSLWSSSSCTAPLGGCCLHATKWIAAASGTSSSPLPPPAPVQRGWLDSVLFPLAVAKSVFNGEV